MTVLSNVSLFYSNASMVFSSQNAYTSFELYAVVIFLFAVFMIMSLYLDGAKQPFEKVLASIVAFLLSFSNALASFSLAIIKSDNAGFVQQTGTGQVVLTQQQAVVPTIIMQNTMTWQVISWIIFIICLINVLNAILLLIDYSRTNGVKKGVL